MKTLRPFALPSLQTLPNELIRGIRFDLQKELKDFHTRHGECDQPRSLLRSTRIAVNHFSLATLICVAGVNPAQVFLYSALEIGSQAAAHHRTPTDSHGQNRSPTNSKALSDSQEVTTRASHERSQSAPHTDAQHNRPVDLKAWENSPVNDGDRRFELSGNMSAAGSSNSSRVSG